MDEYDEFETETLELTNMTLGLRPYVVIELVSFNEETEMFDIDLDFGGGLPQKFIKDVLTAVLENLGD